MGSKNDELMRMRNEKNFFAKLCGIQVTKYAFGYAEAELTVTDNVRNPIGSVHGGCLYTLADVAAGAAAYTYGERATTADCSFHYLRPALSDCKKVIAKATVRKRGRNLDTINIDIVDEEGRQLCFAIATFSVLGGVIDWEALDSNGNDQH